MSGEQCHCNDDVLFEHILHKDCWGPESQAKILEGVRGFISLWDMIINLNLGFVAGAFERCMAMIRLLEKLGDSQFFDAIDPEKQTDVRKEHSRLHAQLKKLGSEKINVSYANIERAFADRESNTVLLNRFRDLSTNFRYELPTILCFVVPEADWKDFGKGWVPESVSRRFQKSVPDLNEAASCFSLGRHPASVQHCMWALDTVLHWLAKKFKRLGAQYDPARTFIENWGDVLKILDKEVKNLEQTNRSPKREKSISYVSEVCNHMRSVKNAWRNPSAHGRKKFGKTESRRILNATIDLVTFLSSPQSGSSS